MPPVPGKLLILYMATTKKAMECVHEQHNEFDRKERAIYYMSKKFIDCEFRYTTVEKFCRALV